MVRDELDAVEEGVDGNSRERNVITSTKIVADRDEKGRIQKGSRAMNPGGFTRREMELKRAIDKLSAPAIATLARLLESENAGAALGAAKEILDRTLGKVRQRVDVDVSVEHTHVMHLDALKRLNDKARQTADTIVIDHVASE
jgi:septation ring formation regulator EzrA